MTRKTKTVVLLVAALGFGCPARVALAEEYRNQWNPTTIEIGKLPQYCFGQFVPSLRQVWLNQIADCGTYMNHFCPGLVLINRAADTTKPKYVRKEDLRQARGEIDYTKKFLKRPCSLERDIEAADARLRVLEMMIK